MLFGLLAAGKKSFWNRTIGSGNGGMVGAWWLQAITWTNVDQVHKNEFTLLVLKAEYIGRTTVKPLI